jgi:hypothetical protein
MYPQCDLQYEHGASKICVFEMYRICHYGHQTLPVLVCGFVTLICYHKVKLGRGGVVQDLPSLGCDCDIACQPGRAQRD